MSNELVTKVLSVSIATCRCHAHLPTNWFSHPPYVRDDTKTKVNESTFNNVVTDIKGIFPPILHAAVKECCAECAIDSPLDFRKTGAKKEGLIQVKENINNNSYISFPIGGIKGQTSYQGHGPVRSIVIYIYIVQLN